MTENCTHVSLECPIEAELYGYAPNLGANLFFVIIFIVCLVIQILAGIRYRCWLFLVFLGLGTLVEAVGYIGRVIMHYNVWNQLGFQIQISMLIQGPLYFSAGLYLTLKHIVLEIDQRHSRLKAAQYTWIFLSLDSACLGLQAAGGGIAAGSESLLTVGTDLMIAGIILQVVVQVAFGYLLVEYFIRVLHHRNTLSPSSTATLNSPRFRYFMVALIFAYLGILIRCVYRLPELLGGWGNPLMRDEIPFIVLEGGAIAMATIFITAFHPGWCFPAMFDKSEAKNKDHAYAFQELGTIRRATWSSQNRLAEAEERC